MHMEHLKLYFFHGTSSVEDAWHARDNKNGGHQGKLVRSVPDCAVMSKMNKVSHKTCFTSADVIELIKKHQHRGQVCFKSNALCRLA